MDPKRRIDRIFMLHLWALAPFALLWLLVPGLRHERDPRIVQGLSLLSLFVAPYLLARTWVVFRGKHPERWAPLWPVVDTLLVAAIIGVGKDSSGLVFLLYLLPIAYAALSLSMGRALAVAALAIAANLWAGLPGWQGAPYQYLWLAFRFLFLLLMASLIGFLAREAIRLREQLALAEYQRELAAEVHDGIQHYLVLIARQLDLVDVLRATDPGRASELAVAQRQVARQAADEVRFMVRRLRPDAPQEADLLGSLRHALTAFTEQADPRVELVSKGEPCPVPLQYHHSLYRMIQEALTNAIKHSRAQHVWISMERVGDRIVTRVTDDGIGFDTEAAARSSEGMGLQALRARAASLRGEVQVRSCPGEGTEVSISLPAKPIRREAKAYGNHPRSAG